ncbi:acyl-CoA thioesterase II [soil metagenome]
MADRLALDPVDDDIDVFVSRRPPNPRHVFGGLLIGQALRAAALTVPSDRTAHALHASFVEAGAGGEPIRYAVERTRDGGAFATRRVVAEQDHGAVFVLTADFQRDEVGVEYEAPGTPGIPGPDDLPPGRYQTSWFDSCDVPNEAVPDVIPHTRRSWFRAAAPVPDDPALHLQSVAYVSDHGPTRAARAPHVELEDPARRQSVSLDHSVWFHRPVDVNDWLLVELVPMATGGGRGLSLGTIRSCAGQLVATVAQEVLLRRR